MAMSITPEHEAAIRVCITTGTAPAAIAVFHLIGDSDSLTALLEALTGHADWPIGAVRHISLGGVDDGLVVRAAENLAQLMPHGGPRVRQRLLLRLIELGAAPAEDVGAHEVYPEARDEVEALMLRALSRAASPMVMDLLLAQPARWKTSHGSLHRDDFERAARLQRLIDPPRVVLIGPANVGKSTLTNALAGRSVALAADQPGTTRDYTVSPINLGGLVVQWFDTPGRRSSDDPLEQQAQRLAAPLLESADLILTMTDDVQPWPVVPMPADRRVDVLRIANKCDRGRRADADLAISALTGAGLPALVERVRETLVPANDLRNPRPWMFDPAFKSSGP